MPGSRPQLASYPLASEPWSQPVDPIAVRRIASALLAEDMPRMLASAQRLLARQFPLDLTERDREALAATNARRPPAAALPADPFDRVGPWYLAPNWPRPLVWDVVNLLCYACYVGFAHDAVTALAAAARRDHLIPGHEVYPDLMLAGVLARAHRLREAQDVVDRVLREHPDLPQPHRAIALQNRGYLAMLFGRASEARDTHREALVLCRQGADAWGEAQSAAILGQIEMHAFDLDEAARLLEHAHAQLIGQGQRWPAWQAAFNLAITRYKQGRPTAALHLVDLVEEPQRRVGQLQGWLLTRLVRAKALLVRADPDAAARVAASVLPHADGRGWARERILALEVIGDAALQRRRLAEATEHYLAARALAAERAPDGNLVVGLDRRLAEERLLAGHAAEAAARLATVRDRARETGETFEEIVAGRLFAAALRAGGRLDDAAAAARDAIRRARQHGTRLELARALLESARVHADRAAGATPAGGSIETAWSHASEAGEVLSSLGEPFADQAACASFLAELRDRWHATLIWTGPARLHRGGSAAVSAAADTAAAAADAFIAGSPVMIRVARLLTLAASTEDPVLITGETGTGKEIAASRIHALGPRASESFVTINCAAIPGSVFEREFFGHVRGAFSGADTDRPGLVERAHRGTLFLDEVGELAPELQVKLLRLLQEGTYRRLGDPTERRADLRLIAATNADLLAMVADGRFRQDLYFRLQVLEIALPPLRDRGDDIHTIARSAAHQAIGPDADAESILGPAHWRAIRLYEWPGNVRELIGIVRRACLHHMVGRPLPPEMLPRRLRELAARVSSAPDDGSITTGPPPPEDLTLTTHLATAERALIRRALAHTRGRRNDAAKLLGISRKSLYEKLKRLEE